MRNGAIRINKIKEDFRDLSDYWLLNMHDNLNGIIPSIQFSYDNKMIFSIGHDGNLFSYEWNIPLERVKTVNTVVPEKVYVKFCFTKRKYFNFFFLLRSEGKVILKIVIFCHLSNRRKKMILREEIKLLMRRKIKFWIY